MIASDFNSQEWIGESERNVQVCFFILIMVKVSSTVRMYEQNELVFYK